MNTISLENVQYRVSCYMQIISELDVDGYLSWADEELNTIKVKLQDVVQLFFHKRQSYKEVEIPIEYEKDVLYKRFYNIHKNTIVH